MLNWNVLVCQNGTLLTVKELMIKKKHLNTLKNTFRLLINKDRKQQKPDITNNSEQSSEA